MDQESRTVEFTRRAMEFGSREGEPTPARVIEGILSFRAPGDTTDFFFWAMFTLVQWSFGDGLVQVDEVLAELLKEELPEDIAASLVALAVRLRGIIPSADAWLDERKEEAEAEARRLSIAEARAKWDEQYAQWRTTGKGEAPWDAEVAQSLEHGLDKHGIRYRRVKVRTVGGKLRFTIVLPDGRTLEDGLPPLQPGQHRCMHGVGAEVAAQVARFLAEEDGG